MVSSIVKESIMYMFNVMSFAYVLCCLENKKISIKNITLYLMLIISLIFSLFIRSSFNNMLRPIMILIVNALIFKKLLNIKLSTSIIDCFIGYIIIVISELIELFLIYIVFGLSNKIINIYILNNVLGSAISLLLVIVLTKLLKTYLVKLKNVFDKEKNTNFLWIIIISLSAFFSLFINNSKMNFNFIMTTLSCSLIIFIILILFKEITDKNELKNEYDQLFNYNKDTESLLTKYQKYNHENKNQLILIRETLSNKEETKKLINEILEDDVEHKNKWLDDLKNIPSGGLKGLMSYKINYMSDKGINVYVSISPRLKDIEISKKISMKTYKELCQMIGIYMDNAYEASIETNEKIVSIEMYYQDDIVNIVISNTFNKKIDLESIDKAGYSTKGRERGIGLSLAKDIVDKNKKINVKREIIHNYYYQYTNLDIS